MKPTRVRQAFLALATFAGLSISMAQAQTPDAVKIGFLTDMSSLFSDIDGKGGVIAVQMAIDDFGGKSLGKPIELLTADHQNKADIGSSKAREWIDTRAVTMLLGGVNSGVALALAKVAQDKQRVLMVIGAGSPALTNEQCNPYVVHYAYDTVALARGTAGAVADAGGKTWFFVTADYLFGHTLEADSTAVIKAKGGTVVGSVRHPLNASDLSPFVLQAQNSKAEVLGLSNGGGDTLNAIKTAKAFGVAEKMKVVAMIFFLSDIHSLGLKATEGMYFTTSWDWNLNDKTRAFARRYFEKTKRMPTDLQAADYSATLNYLKAVEAVNTVDADTVMGYLKKTRLSDMYATGTVRPDGRFEHDMYLMQVKSPSESKTPWDYTKLVKQMRGADVFTTQAETRCSLWKNK